MTCEHTSLFSLATGPRNTHILIHSNRLSSLIAGEELADSSSQAPDMVMFVGGLTKRRILRGVIGGESVRADPSLCNLHLIGSTARTTNPLLIADCIPPDSKTLRPPTVHSSTPFTTNPPFTEQLKCHENMFMALRPSLDPNTISTSLFSRVLGPFSAVVCIFMNDFGGFEGVVRYLRNWMDLTGRTVSSPSETCRPNLLVVEERSDIMFRAEWDAHATDKLREILGQALDDSCLSSFFLSVNVLVVPLGYNLLMKYIRPLLQVTRHIRDVGRCLFSLPHFNDFLISASRHWAQHLPALSPFNFVRSTRIMNPISPSLLEHLNRFFELVTPQYGIEVAVSSLILESSPPGMHRFNPLHVFDGLYKPMLGSAVDPNLLNLMRLRFANMTFIMETEGGGAVRFHRGILYRNRRGLPCGHTICEECVMVFGVKVHPFSYIYSMPHCPLCGTSASKFRANFKPPTAGVRILTISGDGVRSILALRVLRSLELKFSSLTGILGPIQEHFDFSLGTGSGGLVVLGLFLNRWSVQDESPTQFAHVMEKAFNKPRSYLSSILSGNLYNPDKVDEALRRIFGSRMLLDWSNSGPDATKVAVTAEDQSTSSQYLLSNYKGGRHCSPSSKHKIHRDQVPIWEAARSTIATPKYIPPHVLQDGTCLSSWAGEPVSIARSEVDMIWSPGTVSDTLLSIGTDPSISTGCSVRARDGCSFAHCYLYMMSSFGGAPDQLSPSVDNAKQRTADYFQINAKLGPLEKVDDLRVIGQMETYTTTTSHTHAATEIDIIETLIAKLFYFELSSAPRFWGGRYYCHGYICCRFTPSRQSQLLEHLASKCAHFVVGDQVIGTLGSGRLPGVDFVYGQGVKFKVNHMSERFVIELRGFDMKSKAISGFPVSAGHLMQIQRLNDPFNLRTSDRITNEVTERG